SPSPENHAPDQAAAAPARHRADPCDSRSAVPDKTARDSHAACHWLTVRSDPDFAQHPAQSATLRLSLDRTTQPEKERVQEYVTARHRMAAGAPASSAGRSAPNPAAADHWRNQAPNWNRAKRL